MKRPSTFWALFASSSVACDASGADGAPSSDDDDVRISDDCPGDLTRDACISSSCAPIVGRRFGRSGTETYLGCMAGQPCGGLVTCATRPDAGLAECFVFSSDCIPEDLREVPCSSCVDGGS
jgi:hypothetical protein